MTLILASLGAEVIKIEEPERGDYMRHIPPFVGGKGAVFQALNRGKKSVVLDLKSENGRRKFLSLVLKSDILVEGFRPGVMKRLGLEFEELKKLNPALIYCAITGYGQDSPLAGHPGHDLNFCAVSGLLSVNENRPIPFQIADIAGGSMWGCIAILSALIERGKSGLGMFLDISMCDGALTFLMPHLAEFSAQDFAGGRPWKILSGSEWYYTTYETSDGRYFSIANLEPHFLESFLDSVKPMIGDSREDLDKRLGAMFKTRSAAEWDSFFRDKEVCCEPVLDLDDLPSAPHHKTRGNFIHFKVADEKTLTLPRIPLPVPDESDLPPAPELGQHNREFFDESNSSPNAA